MKRLFVGLIALVALAAAGVVAAPSLIDWNDHKARVATALGPLFGRDVRIAGALDLSLLPTPMISAADVTVGAADAPEALAPVRLSAVEIAVAPLSFLQGKVRVLRAVLVDPEIEITRRDDGRLVWPIALGSPAQASGPASALDTVTLERVTLSNGRILVFDERGEEALQLTDIFAQFAGNLSTGEASLTGSLMAGGLPITMDATSRAQSRNGSVPLTVSLGIDGSDNELRYAGLLGRQEEGSALQHLASGRWDQLRLQGDVSLRGSDLGEALVRLAYLESAPPVLAQDFALDARFSASAGQASTNRLTFSLGEIEGDGEITYDRMASPAAVAKAVIGRFDLDTVLAGSEPARASPRKALGALLAMIDGAGAGTPGLLGALPRSELYLSFDRLGLFGDELHHVRLHAQSELQQVQLAGFQATVPGEGDLRARGGLDWSGAAPAATLDASLDNAAYAPLAEWLGLAVDDAEGAPVSSVSLRGSLSGGPGRWEATGLEVMLDATRLWGSVAYGAGEVPGLGLRLRADRLNLDTYRPSGFDGTTLQWLASLPPVRDMAAGGPVATINFDLEADELLADSRRITGFAARGTADPRSLRLKELSADDFAGAALALTGSYAFADGQAEAGQEDTAPLDLSLSLTTADLADLAGELGFDLPVLPQDPPSAEVRARVSGEPGGTLKTSLSGALAGAEVNLGGTLETAADPAWTGAVRIVHPDAKTVFQAYLPGYAPEGAAGVFDLYARLDGGIGDMAVSELIGSIGPAALAGDGRVRWQAGPDGPDRSAPHIEVALRTGAIDLSDWVPPQSSTSFGRWPGKRLGLGWLGALESDIRLAGRSVRWNGIELDNPAISLATREGRLELERFSAEGWGGRIGLSGTLEPGEPAHGLTGRIDVVGAQARLFLGELVGASPLDGLLDFGASFETSGISVRDWVSQLSGSALLSARNGTLDDMDLAEAAQWVAADEEPVDFLQGLRGSLATGDTPFEALNAEMEITQGRLHTDDLRIAAIETTAAGKGSFDLNRWDIDLTTDFTLRRLPKAPPLVLRLEGPADRPQRRWLTEAVQAYVAQRAARALSNQFIEPDPEGTGTEAPGALSPSAAPSPDPATGQEPGAEAALPVQEPFVQ